MSRWPPKPYASKGRKALLGRKGHLSAARRPKGPGKSELDRFRLEIKASVARCFVVKHFGAASANLSNQLGWRGTEKPEA